MKERYILTGEVQFGRQYQITDSETDYKYENNKSDKQKICDLLNKVIDENEQLKKQNDFLTTQLAELSTYMMALGYDIELEFEDGRVIKLNEELKGDVE